jgi:hypothetical protein
MKLTHKQNCITMAMAADDRLPVNALGYVRDLQSAEISESVREDRFKMLSRYIPDLVSEFKTSSAAATLGRKGGAVKSERKSKSSAENGRTGGRPKKEKPEPSRI